MTDTPIPPATEIPADSWDKQVAKLEERITTLEAALREAREKASIYAACDLEKSGALRVSHCGCRERLLDLCRALTEVSDTEENPE